MKKNWTLRIGALVLVLTLVSACLVGGTISKYTSTVTGDDSARVALWQFDIGGTPLPSQTNVFTFDLFNTVSDIGATTDDTDVADTTDAAAIIAPGTTGSFTIDMQNTGEVNATYALTLSSVVNANNIPVEFSLTGTEWVSAVGGTVSFSGQAGQTGTLAMDAAAATSVTVYWRWVFDDATSSGTYDAADTALGVDGTATISVTAQIVLTQID